MEIIGISGQTGAGKSTLGELMTKQGYGKNIDVDALGHELLRDETTIKQLTNAFGDDIVGCDFQIDRKKLGAKAFASPKATELLNSIMHPNMVKMVEGIIAKEKEAGAKSIIVNAALLYKMKLDKLCTKILYVKADPEVRLKRLVENRGMSEEAARARLFSQDPEPEASSTTIILDNSGSLDNLISQLESVC